MPSRITRKNWHPPEVYKGLEKSLAKAMELKEQLFRKTAKTEARFVLAMDRVKDIGGIVIDEN